MLTNILFGLAVAFIVFLVVLDFLQKLMTIEEWEEKNDTKTSY